MLTLFTQGPTTALDRADAQRSGNAVYGDNVERAQLGQYATPAPLARFLAEILFPAPVAPIRLLDPGTGMGALSLACVEQLRERAGGGALEITGYEVAGRAAAAARANLASAQLGLTDFEFQVHQTDYLTAPPPAQPYTHAILNPPYKKLPTSDPRQASLRGCGIQVVNLYAAFVWKALTELAPGGHLVAIIPRSFCNGTYSRPFRQFLRKHTTTLRIHSFDARDQVFADDSVLQENVILRLRKQSVERAPADALLTWSAGRSAATLEERRVPATSLWWDPDGEAILRLQRHGSPAPLPNGTLDELGVEVSTGPVVDFRCADHLRRADAPDAFPLLRPRHFAHGRCIWPREAGKRAGGIARVDETEKFFWPAGYYVVVRRISSKEEPRRVVASVVQPTDFSHGELCFENHLNVYHIGRRGLDESLAHGLCTYLNGEVVDCFLRSISGHTQVNVSDLKTLPYPTQRELMAFAKTPEA